MFNIANTFRAKSSALHENCTDSPDLEFTGTRQKTGSGSHQPLELPQQSLFHVKDFFHYSDGKLLLIHLRLHWTKLFLNSAHLSAEELDCELMGKGGSVRYQSAEYAEDIRNKGQ